MKIILLLLLLPFLVFGGGSEVSDRQEDGLSISFNILIDWLILLLGWGGGSGSGDSDSGGLETCPKNLEKYYAYFVGGRMTARNGLISRVESYADDVDYELDTDEAYDSDEVSLKELMEEIEPGDYHILVLQEGPTAILKDPEESKKSVKEIIELFPSVCQVIIFEPPAYKDSETFLDDQKKIHEWAKEISTEVGAAHSPVGQAFKIILDNEGYSDLSSLYYGESALSYSGSRLAACVIASTITDQVLDPLSSDHNEACKGAYEIAS